MTTNFKTNWHELRQLCVDNDFYTRGTNDEYTEMFHTFGKIDVAKNFEEVTKTLKAVAADILDHSVEENYILYSDYKDNQKELMSLILEKAVDIYFD